MIYHCTSIDNNHYMCSLPVLIIDVIFPNFSYPNTIHLNSLGPSLFRKLTFYSVIIYIYIYIYSRPCFHCTFNLLIISSLFINFLLFFCICCFPPGFPPGFPPVCHPSELIELYMGIEHIEAHGLLHGLQPMDGVLSYFCSSAPSLPAVLSSSLTSGLSYWLARRLPVSEVAKLSLLSENRPTIRLKDGMRMLEVCVCACMRVCVSWSSLYWHQA